MIKTCFCIAKNRVININSNKYNGAAVITPAEAVVSIKYSGSLLLQNTLSSRKIVDLGLPLLDLLCDGWLLKLLSIFFKHPPLAPQSIRRRVRHSYWTCAVFCLCQSTASRLVDHKTFQLQLCVLKSYFFIILVTHVVDHRATRSIINKSYNESIAVRLPIFL